MVSSLFSTCVGMVDTFVVGNKKFYDMQWSITFFFTIASYQLYHLHLINVDLDIPFSENRA